MKLLFTDPHIEESNIEELRLVLDEIRDYRADVIIMLGDFFHKKKPTPREIIFGTMVAKSLVTEYQKVIFLRGNHDKTEDISAVDYLKYLGVKIVDSYIDEDNNFFGHFMLHESKLQYGTGKCGIKDLKKYNNVILGHQHSFQELNPKIYHLGSIRYVNFNEVEDKCKYIATLDKELKFIKLKSQIPMIDVNSLDELEDVEFNSKVRLIVSSFDQFKREINYIGEWRKKFKEFKIKLDFKERVAQEEIVKLNKTKKLQSIINEFIDRIGDEEVKKELREEFDKENL